MKPEDHIGYLNGLTLMASAVSVRCGPSEMRADCFSPKSFPALFCASYRIPKKLLQLRESEQSLEQLLEDRLGTEPKHVTESLCYFLHRRFGDCVRCFEIENAGKLLDALSASDGGRGPFYTMDDLFFAEFRGVAVCFMLGNYE